ncbi:MAG: mannose-1-phosphate guanylyltransferase [Candidatus Omnitrophica bacterium]|nr:mannose-1-phosphate guanylyltransferase [Candidatus Omnitrophota bacterium]
MIHAVILAGGWGSRFWPQSRKKFPKQLLCIAKGYSPLENLLKILRPQIPRERIWLVTNQEHLQGLCRQLPGLSRKNILAEPLAKNTAAAIGWAAVTVKKADPQALMVVLSSDQIFGQKKLIWQAIRDACKRAREQNALVVMGIRPNRAATEYGYLKIARRRGKIQNSRIYKVEKFTEKPNLKSAQRFFKNKNYLWNAGIFVWQAAAILEAFKKYLPKTYAGLENIDKAFGRRQYSAQLVKAYRRFKNISIDYGILEKARNIYAVVGNFLWRDLGSWQSLAQGILRPDGMGNVVSGLHKGIKTKNSVIFSGDKHLIATLGVHNLVIVHTPSATLVCRKDQAQDVKKLTHALEKDQRFKKYL